jgi:hypothetical protein
VINEKINKLFAFLWKPEAYENIKKLPLLHHILTCVISFIILPTYFFLILFFRICLDLALDLSALGFTLKIIYVLVTFTMRAMRFLGFAVFNFITV